MNKRRKIHHKNHKKDKMHKNLFVIFVMFL
jgi:hypothetical protein